VKGLCCTAQTPRLLHVDGIEVEAPSRANLVYENSDVPE